MTTRTIVSGQGRRYCPTCGRWTLTFRKQSDGSSKIEFRPILTKIHVYAKGYTCDECYHGGARR